MAMPRFRIGNLMIFVAVAGVYLSGLRAVGGSYLFHACLSCWPLLMILSTVWAFEVVGWQPRSGESLPIGGGSSRRFRGLMVLGSAVVVVALGIYCRQDEPAWSAFQLAGFSSLFVPAVVTISMLMGTVGGSEEASMVGSAPQTVPISPIRGAGLEKIA